MGTIVIFSKYIYFLPVVILHVHASSSFPYVIHNLESDKTCAVNSLQSRVLKVSSKSGLIVQENNYFDHGSFSGKYRLKCAFKVDAPSDAGIFAVIQEMKLRKNETTGECIDYVQFRHTNSIDLPLIDISISRKDDHPWSEKICGKVNGKERDFHSIDLTNSQDTLPHAFIDPEGKIDVKIYVANGTRSRDTELDLKIAFTSFHACSKVTSPLYKKCNPSYCIWGDFFKDDILNCPYTSCLDVGGCPLIYEAGFRPSTSLATKILVGAVAGVFTMFFVFILFLWMFRSCAACWNSPAPSAQNTTQMRPVPTAEEIQPTAPPRPLAIDKDLPPSYESLFPNP